jgi:glucose-1-phosphatase
MTLIPSQIKNIILDLGGVIINLDFDKTTTSFNQLMKIPFQDIYSQSKQTELFNKLDKGLISEPDFFKELQRLIEYTGPEEDIRNTWNAMLLDVPAYRLELLDRLKQKYRTFLLSNTCEPHITAFERDLKAVHGIDNFENHFEKVYYSCRTGFRKPDRDIFEMVLKENKLEANETVFIDDSEQHVNGAKDCGIHAFLLQKNQEVEDLLKELRLL